MQHTNVLCSTIGKMLTTEFKKMLSLWKPQIKNC